MKKSIIIAIIVAAVVIPAGVYGASPLFINTTIDEPAPVGTMDDKTESSGSDIGEEPMSDDTKLLGNFIGVGDGIHNAEGLATVIPLDGRSVLRLEDFRSTNGPDLYVYLSTDKQASEFLDLGRLKANNGNQNYEIPDGTDLSKYDTVLIWCKSFSVLFGSAALTESPSA